MIRKIIEKLPDAVTAVTGNRWRIIFFYGEIKLYHVDLASPFEIGDWITGDECQNCGCIDSTELPSRRGEFAICHYCMMPIRIRKEPRK